MPDPGSRDTAGATAALNRHGGTLRGEEFILILPNTDENGAIQVAENARVAIEALDIRHDHSTARDCITVSVGCATIVPDDKSSLEELVFAADAALYKAKESGRNRIQAAESA